MSKRRFAPPPGPSMRRAPGPAAVRLAAAVVALAVVVAPARAAADVPAAVAVVEATPREATIGDRIAFRFSVDLPAGWTVVWPDMGRAFGPFEVVGVGPGRLEAGGAAAGGTVRATRVVTGTAFTTGTLRTPALTLTVVGGDGAAHPVTAPAVDVAIRSVLTPQDANPAGPRGPVSLPIPSQWPLLAGGLSAVAALLAVLLWALRRMIGRRRRGAALQDVVPDLRSALDRARAELDALAREDLPRRGRVVEHYTRLADALRAFVERSFHVPALERTTAELAGAFGPMGTRDPEVEPLLAVLGDADLVKFAGIVPDAAVARASLSDAQALIGPLWGAAERRRIAAEAAAAEAAGGDDVDASIAAEGAPIVHVEAPIVADAVPVITDGAPADPEDAP